MTESVNVYDMWGPATRANPHPIYEQIRNEQPVYRAIGPVSGNTFWFITRYDDCVEALKHQRIGKDFRKHLTPEQLERYPQESAEFEVVNRHMLNMDPPDHTRLRALVHKAFTPRIVESLQPRIQQITDDLIDAMRDKSEVDLIESFGFPLPITVIAELLGVPAEDRDRFRAWTKTLLFDLNEDNSRLAAMEFAMYTHSLIDQRHENPRDDLITGLINAEEEGDKLDRQELLSMIFLLLVAGHETTVNLIGNGTLALLQHPDQMQKHIDNPALIKTAVEEMLRYNSPVENALSRWAYEDIEIGGMVIPAGDIVLASLMAANRDPAHFENPHTFDITREPNRHIAFGQGIHYCLGSPLARIEGAVAINTLLRRVRGLELAIDPDKLEWNNSILLHGMKALPVRYQSAD
jgi:cytochrome P450